MNNDVRTPRKQHTPASRWTVEFIGVVCAVIITVTHSHVANTTTILAPELSWGTTLLI